MATVNQVRDAVSDLQQAGVIAVEDVSVRVEWGPGALAGDPLGGDVRVLLAANAPDQPPAFETPSEPAGPNCRSVASDGSGEL